MANCIIHPDREAELDVFGIEVCDDCYDRYRVERGMSNGDMRQRPFLQSLVNARHGLKGKVEQNGERFPAIQSHNAAKI